ncbi:hypothetical protein [Streptomyces sp. NPDC046984]|uniref:hypothetical protein n=1 Tax=unclassified Streptomyces TaxID=2593676 RepID=UPI0033CDF795
MTVDQITRPPRGQHLRRIWVTTSFNWLSFKGDPNRTHRMEEGSLVRNHQITDAQYTRYLKLIDEQRR